jgi:hypothetical protein
MDNHEHTPAKIHNFSLAFQQMCSMVAIGQTKSQDETLRELILQTLVLLPDEKISNEVEFSTVMNSLFGLQIADHEIKYAIEKLTAEGAIKPSDSGVLTIDAKINTSLRYAIDSSVNLENKVRDRWQDEISKGYPNLEFTAAWSALRNYLAGAFLRHGIQAVALLDSSFDLDHIHSHSLSEILKDTVKDIPDELKLDAKNAISNFLANTGSFPERATYIAQLADGAFSYFNLASDPKISEDFRSHLNPLSLFLDTNFLFGILGLTVNPQVAVSNDLIRVIQSFKFPFTLKRHIKTESELNITVTNYEDELSKRRWSKSISRAALTSRFISGVETKYHQAYIESGVDVQSFFLPYHHADVLLEEKQIEKDKTVTTDEKSQQRIATLIADYEEFLKRKGRDKFYKPIEHDMTLLDIVRQLRSDTRSTLDAGALIITCDYSLYAFDWEISKNQGLRPCTVLPNLFWQVLRPFVPSDENFSQAFAQTFAIPEFRIIGSGAAKACSKMMNILSGYKDFPEETAKRMLSNDILIEQLRKAENDEAFQNYVEAAIVDENAQLLGENMLLNKKIEMEQAGKKEVSRKLKQTNELARQNEGRYKFEQTERIKAKEDANMAKAEQRKAEETVKKEREERLKVERELQSAYTFIATILGVASIGIFEWLIYYLPWTWLISHPNSYGLQGSIDLLILSIFLFTFIPKWRKSVVLPLIISIVGIVFTLLGGPK